MPTYEYACAACGNEFEAFQSIKDPALTACPKCGEDKAKRQISRGAGFILKGGGWYSDLYASPAGNKKPSGDGGSSSGSSGDGGSSGSGSTGVSSPGGSSSGGDSGGGSSTPTPTTPSKPADTGTKPASS